MNDYVSSRKVIRVTHQPTISADDSAIRNFNLYVPKCSEDSTPTTFPPESLPFVRLRPTVEEDRKIKSIKTLSAKQAFVPSIKFRNDVDSILNSPASHFVSEEQLLQPKQMEVLMTLFESNSENKSILPKDNGSDKAVAISSLSPEKSKTCLPVGTSSPNMSTAPELPKESPLLEMKQTSSSSVDISKRHCTPSIDPILLTAPRLGHFKDVFYPKAHRALITAADGSLKSPHAIASNIGSGTPAIKLKVDPKNIILSKDFPRWYPLGETPNTPKGTTTSDTLRPVIGKPLSVPVETSLIYEVSDRVSKKDKIIEAVASLFKQNPQAQLKSSKKGNKNNSSSGRRPTSQPQRGDTPKKKKKKKGPAVKPSAVTEVAPNMRIFFKVLRRHMDDTGRLNSTQFSNFIRDISGGIDAEQDICLAENLFHKFKSKNISPGFVLVGSCIAALHELFNGPMSDKVIDACFDLFDLDGRGYIHKSHLDQLRLMKTPLEGGNSEGVRTLTVHYEKILHEAEPPQEESSTSGIGIPQPLSARSMGSTFSGTKGSLGLLHSSTSTGSLGNIHSAESTLRTELFPGTSPPSAGPPKPHQVCTPSMVKVLGDIFIDMRKKEEEEYILKVFKKGKPKSKKKPPPLKPTQQSVIPLNLMRVSHISKTVFRRYMAEHGELAAVFARRWLLVIDQDDEVGRAVEEAVDSHEMQSLRLEKAQETVAEKSGEGGEDPFPSLSTIALDA